MPLDCVVFPSSRKGRLLDLVHEGCQGVVRALRKVKKAVWWPGFSAQVRNKLANFRPSAWFSK